MKAKEKALAPKSGEHERLALMKRRAITIRAEGCTLYETAEAIAKEFDLERVPTHPTIIRWCNDQIDTLKEDYDRIALSYRMEQDAEIEQWLRQLRPIILGGHGLRIQRWKQTAEGPEPFIDENAYDEWMKAIDRGLKLLQRRARLWNLDLTQVKIDTGEGPKSLQELQLWINQTIFYGPQNGEKPLKNVEPLSLESGLEEHGIDMV